MSCTKCSRLLNYGINSQSLFVKLKEVLKRSDLLWLWLSKHILAQVVQWKGVAALHFIWILLTAFQCLGPLNSLSIITLRLQTLTKKSCFQYWLLQNLTFCITEFSSSWPVQQLMSPQLQWIKCSCTTVKLSKSPNGDHSHKKCLVCCVLNYSHHYMADVATSRLRPHALLVWQRPEALHFGRSYFVEH